jgi:YjbE family integral membrane protein
MFDPLVIDRIMSFISVVAIDLTLAGDNAVVVGMAAAGLAPELRRRAIIIGIVAATLFRIVFALATVQILQIVGLMVAGGLLLLWVSWKLWRELREETGLGGGIDDPLAEGAGQGTAHPRKTLRQAVIQILIADVTMSLDNVIAVAGAAREHPYIMIFGLALSIALMGFAAVWIARLLQRHHWIGYVGLVLIVVVAVSMIWDGSAEVMRAVEAAGYWE